jgi:tetrahydromethanopterin S-methyltransferase subunit F
VELPQDLIDLLAEFAAAQVEYLLIGGQAVGLHGIPRFTKDADLWVHDVPANLLRARDALLSFGAPAATIEGLASAVALDVVWMGNPPVRIDLMKNVPGGDFARAWQSRMTFDVRGVPVSCIGREELICLKRESGRPQDLVDVASLMSATTSE